MIETSKQNAMNLTTFPNKLRLITQHIPNSESVTALVLVGAGSRYESKDINGISHFLEHMFFKGGKQFKNTKEVSQAIDGVGGDFNAFTGKEYAGYYVKVSKNHLQTALDVLSDMMIHARHPKEEIEKERGVILEELNMYQDTPMYQIGWDFEKLIFGDTPLGRDTIGTKELIKNVSQKQFFDYQEKLYTPDNTVIAIVGNIDEDKVIKQIPELFAFPDSKKSLEFTPFQGYQTQDQVHIIHKNTDQAHLIMGFPGTSLESEDRWATKLLSIILGGNMSSRMFLNIREKRGLCYYINTSNDEYFNAGIISTRAGVDVKRIEEALTSIQAEYREIRENGAFEDELHRAKEYLKGKLSLKLEDTEEQAHFLARQELIIKDKMNLKQIIKKIDSVSLAEVNAIAKKFLVDKNLYTSIIGPYTTEEIQNILNKN